MPRSKRYQALKQLVDPKKFYSPTEAVALVKQTSSTKFDGTIETHLNLGIDVKKGDQQVRATLLFPHSTGKTKRVAAFVSAVKEKEAKEAGADLVGAEDLIEEIAKTGNVNFDVAVASPDMMVKLSKIAKILGPIGLMPNPKTETVGPNIGKMVGDIKRGKVAFKNDATGNIHQAIGKSSSSPEALLENLRMFMEAVKKAKPAASKGTYIRSLTLASTMGPGVKVDLTKFEE